VSMYDGLAGKYDQMIRWKSRLERETPFLQNLFTEKRIRKVVDLACGSGHHCKLFHKWGCEVIGIDPSEELLKIAKEGLSEEDESIRFIKADFQNFNEYIDTEVDAVFCLGNSLPHILSIEDMKTALGNVNKILKPGGVFVFQNRNYDKLLGSKDRFQFPTTFRAADNEEIFFRFNDFENTNIRFNIVHFTRVGDRWIHEVFSTKLMPWQYEDFSAMITEIGFAGQHYYGDFTGTPFDPDSSTDLVGLVRKQEVAVLE